MNLATETMKGMRENAERGYVNGGCVPYGFRNKRLADAKGREHVVLELGPPEEVATVREIFEMAGNQGLGAKQISNDLNVRGVKPPRSKFWNKSTVTHILNSRLYTGDLVWNRRGKTKRINDPAKWVVTEKTHEPIVDRELFFKRKQMAQSRTFNLSRSPRRFVKYLLSRMIECGHCGHNFVGHRQLKRNGAGGAVYDIFRYTCNGYINMGKSVCPALSIDREWIEGQVLAAIRREICTPDRLDELEALVRQKIEARRQAYGQSPRAAEQKLATIDQKIRHYYDAIGEGLDPAVCRQKIADLQAQREKLQEEANVLRREDYYVKALQKNVSGVREFAAAFTERFGAMPFPAQRQVILHFVEKMKVVDRKAVELTLRVPFDNNGVQLLADETPPDDSARAAAAGQIGGMSSLIEKGSRAAERLSPFQPGVVGGAISSPFKLGDQLLNGRPRFAHDACFENVTTLPPGSRVSRNPLS
jgi:hypothetical protein